MAASDKRQKVFVTLSPDPPLSSCAELKGKYANNSAHYRILHGDIPETRAENVMNGLE
jgi:hypothetical protein